MDPLMQESYICRQKAKHQVTRMSKYLYCTIWLNSTARSDMKLQDYILHITVDEKQVCL